MSTYTNDENIRFLHDKNISQTLRDDTARQTNTVPSLDLLNEVHNALTAYDSNLCAYLDSLNEHYEYDATSPYLSVITRIEQVKGQLTGFESVELLSSHVKNLKEFVEDTIDSLDVATLSETNKFIRTLTEIDGKIQATFTNVLSSDLDGQLQQTQIENLTADIESCYKKDGGLINGNAQVNGQLSVASDSIVTGNSTVRGNLIQGRGTSYTGDAIHSVVLGISASTNKDDVFLWNGKQNEAYTDHGRGTFNINAVSGVNGVFVGNQTLETIVDNKRELARSQAKEYTDSVSAGLSTDYISKIATAKSQAYNEALSDANDYTNGASHQLSTDYISKIATSKSQAYNEALSDANAYTDGVSATLSTDYISKIATSKSQAYNEALSDANDYTDALDTKLATIGTLVSADLAFSYNESTRLITLNIKDYTGYDHTFTIDSARFIKGRIVDHVNIVELDGQQVLRIWWTVEEGGTGVYSDVPLATLAQVYTQGEGIKIVLQENGGYVISVDDTIVNKTLLSEKVAEINATTSALDERLVNDEASINSISANLYNDAQPRISALESGLNAANGNIQSNATNIADSNSHIQSLESYATALSAPYGQIQTLSNAITANYEYAHDKLSSRIATDEEKIGVVSAHVGRLQEYANILSGGNGQIQTLSSKINNNTADIALANGNIDSLQTYATSLSAPNGQIQTLSNAITANASDISKNSTDIGTISAHANDLQTYADQLSNYGGIIDTIHNNINQLSTSIIDSDSFIGEIKVNYNNLTAGTAQAWVSQNGNALSGVLKHFTLAPLGYVKQNTIIKVTFTNVPENISWTKFAELKYLKYTTDDGVVFTDNDYIIIHGEFDQVKLEDITPANVHYVNAIKRNELFELSNTVYANYAWLSGNSAQNNHVISGENDIIALTIHNYAQVDGKFKVTGCLTAVNDEIDISVPISSISNISAYKLTITNNISAGNNISAATSIYAGNQLSIGGNCSVNSLIVRNILSTNSTAISLNSKSISGLLSGTHATNAATYGQLSATRIELSTDYVGKIATAKSEAIETAKTNATAYSNSVSAALSTDYVGKIATAKSEAIETAKSYSNSISTTLSTDYVNKIGSATNILSASMFTALKKSILNAVYPVGSIYVDATLTASECPIQSALGGTWSKTDSATIKITKNEISVDAPLWTRTN